MIRNYFSFPLVAFLVLNSLSFAAEQGEPKGGLFSADMQTWIHDTKALNLKRFNEMYPENDAEVNRLEVAKDGEMQKIIFAQAEKLSKLLELMNEDKLKALFQQFRSLRIGSQPSGSVGQSPSQTNAPKDMAALHTTVGVAEIVIRDPAQWRENLGEHFSRVGGDQVR